MRNNMPKNRIDAFDDGLLDNKELSILCEDVIHELNCRGLLVWPSLGISEEYEGQIVIIDTEEELWKPARAIKTALTGVYSEPTEDDVHKV